MKNIISEEQKRALTKPLIFLAGILLLCTILARSLSGGETLSEYASKNPDKAYATSVSNNSQVFDD